METIGERIRRLRKKNDLGLNVLAEKVGMSSQALWNLENDVVGKSFVKLAPLAKALGCRIDDLFPEMDETQEDKTVCADGFEDEAMEGWSE
jgi:transcriptional regulator with XRE-family HTH domain